MPGKIRAHTHFYGAFTRCMSIPGTAPKDFPEILDKLWWSLDLALDENAVRASAQVMLIDAIRFASGRIVATFGLHASTILLDKTLEI